ncbi:MAG: hypothetical protein LBM26_02980 [Methanobrevibacter sp.]|jgi:hypothetical protein|nr:hypothetical protein [Methanobrevibacter sp.]
MDKNSKIVYILVVIGCIIVLMLCIKHIEDPYNLGLSKSLDEDYDSTVRTFEVYDENKDGKLDFEEYKREFENMDSFSNGFTGGNRETSQDMIRKVFDYENLDNDLFLSPEEVYNSFKRV